MVIKPIHHIRTGMNSGARADAFGIGLLYAVGVKVFTPEFIPVVI